MRESSFWWTAGPPSTTAPGSSGTARSVGRRGERSNFSRLADRTTLRRVTAPTRPAQNVVSQATEDALNDALQAHLRDADVLEAGELLAAWVIGFAAEIPTEPDAARYGHSSPGGQRYHVSHGLAAGLFAAFNAGVGMVAGHDGEEGY